MLEKIVATVANHLLLFLMHGINQRSKVREKRVVDSQMVKMVIRLLL